MELYCLMKADKNKWIKLQDYLDNRSENKVLPKVGKKYWLLIVKTEGEALLNVGCSFRVTRVTLSRRVAFGKYLKDTRDTAR